MDLKRILSLNQGSIARPPVLNCQVFTGEEDRDEFRQFLLQFENLVGDREDLQDSVKLQYLKAYTAGLALREIKHLSNTNVNYEIAMKILKKRFLNVPLLVDNLLSKICSQSKLNGHNIDSIYKYIAEMRAYFYELKEFGYDFFEQSSGNKMASHILMQKLPDQFFVELRLVTGENYPSLSDIFDNYEGVLRTLEILHIRNRKDNSKKVLSCQTSFKSFQENETNINTSTAVRSNKGETKEADTVCKMCFTKGHFMGQCSLYATPKQRKDRCLELELCSNCYSSRHTSEKCPALLMGLPKG